MEDIQETKEKFFNEFKELKKRRDREDLSVNLIPLYYNNEKNKGVGTIIKKKEKENQKYNEQDYPIILKYPGIMKIEQIFVLKNKIDTHYLFIMEESLSNLYYLNNNILHGDKPYSRLKICNNALDIVGDNLLKYFIKQLIYLIEFIDRNNLCLEDLSLTKFLITKKDFSLRLYNFENVKILKEEEKQLEKKSKKKNSSINANDDIAEKNELERKKNYFQIGKFIYELIFDNTFFGEKKDKKVNENSKLFEDQKIDSIMRNIKQIKAKNIDQNIKNLLIKLLDYDPECRPNIEEIFRNKWIHQDYQIIDDIKSNFEKDIMKIISEFAKHDYLKKICKYCKKDKNKKKIIIIIIIIL